MTARPVLVGIDVLDVERIGRALSFDGDSWARHVTGPGERPLDPDPVQAAAASIAVKESLVKAIGGRPPGFSWHDFGARDGGREPPAELLADATLAVADATGLALTRTGTYDVRGASGAAAGARLGIRPCDVVAAARWGRRGARLIAVAVLTFVTKGTH